VSRGWRLVAVLALGLCSAYAMPERAEAQRRSEPGLFEGSVDVGLRGGRDFTNKAWTLGAQAEVPLRGNLKLRPSGDLLFPKHEGMGWQLNGDGAVHLGQGGGLFAGGGIALVHPHGGDTDRGYNLFFGLSTAPPDQDTKGFIEFRWTFVNDTSPFKLALGFMHQL
jgi:hypothetical protein